jgi:hypothetical protein
MERLAYLQALEKRLHNQVTDGDNKPVYVPFPEALRYFSARNICLAALSLSEEGKITE